jgi:glycosyltransferase involved in cell wall biosynthesis
LPDKIPTISVITVCYNAAHLLKKTIESVIEQTYSNFEYIIIDGASDDRTKEVVKQFENRVDHFISEPDTGIYDAMNKGIHISTGELIIFLNAGDYFISKDVLAFSISKMNFEKAHLFFGRFIWNDPRTCDIILSDHEWVTYTWDLQESNFPHPATFYKKHLFDEIGSFDTSYTLGADYEWNMRALVKNKIAFQYINIATTIFFADGLSNKEELSQSNMDERKRIFKEYLKPRWIYNLGFKHNSPDRHTRQKYISKMFNCRLNRVG